MEREPLVSEKRGDNFKMLGSVMTISNSRQYVHRAYVVYVTSIDLAPLTQLARVSARHAESRWFKSNKVHMEFIA